MNLRVVQYCQLDSIGSYLLSIGKPDSPLVKSAQRVGVPSDTNRFHRRFRVSVRKTCHQAAYEGVESRSHGVHWIHWTRKDCIVDFLYLTDLVYVRFGICRSLNACGPLASDVTRNEHLVVRSLL